MVYMCLAVVAVCLSFSCESQLWEAIATQPEEKEHLALSCLSHPLPQRKGAGDSVNVVFQSQTMPQYFGQLHTTEPAWSTIGAVQAIQQDESPYPLQMW
jgi:hypothetical protein